MKEIASKYNVEVQERISPKGIDIIPAIIAGKIDVSASAVDSAISPGGNVPIVIVAGFAKALVTKEQRRCHDAEMHTAECN